MASGSSSSPPPPAVNNMNQPPAKRLKLAPNPMSPPPISSYPPSPSPLQPNLASQSPILNAQSPHHIPPPTPPPQMQQQQQYHQHQHQHQQQQQYYQQQQQTQQQQQQQHASTSMPPPSAPPSKPTEAPLKPTDPSDLADALTSAGIDLKEEEAKLASFSTGTGSASNSYLDPSLPPNSDEAYRLAQRRQAETRAVHLNNPFVDPRALSNRLLKKTREAHCKEFTLRDQTAGQVMTSGPQADIVTLLSLACKERVTALLNRSIVLGRTRRRGHNVVTGEWANFVKGYNPDNKPDSTTMISPRTNPNPLKRSFSAANNLPPPLPSISEPPLTTTLTNETAKALRAIQTRDFLAEQARLEKKAKRDSAPASNGPGTSVPSTPAPDASSSSPMTPADERRMSAKESRKHQASKIEEAASHRAANATANMMMGGAFGGFGNKKKKKSYAWMNAMPGAVSGGGTVARGPGTPTESAPVDTWSGGQRFGAWRDDGERGAGVQIRDWVAALEGDGRGVRKDVAQAYMKMK
ncbi:hypothetical protein RUND412_010082 [Rhizina undulata]